MINLIDIAIMLLFAVIFSFMGVGVANMIGLNIQPKKGRKPYSKIRELQTKLRDKK